jgi:hypothetical protein
MAKSSVNSSDYLKTLEVEIEKLALHKKVPSLPDNVKEIIVKLTPWLILLSMIMFVPIILTALGISTLMLPLSYLGGIRLGISHTLGLIFALIYLILEGLALPGLFKRQQKAWRLLFYLSLLTVLKNLLNFDLGSLIIGGAISFYFLFQVKSKYTK